MATSADVVVPAYQALTAKDVVDAIAALKAAVAALENA